jgi:DNA-binding helix-hairpin-helix protein with protein kinase domain
MRQLKARFGLATVIWQLLPPTITAFHMTAIGDSGSATATMIAQAVTAALSLLAMMLPNSLTTAHLNCRTAAH